MPASLRSPHVRAAALALTAALLLAAGVGPALARTLRSLAHRPSESVAMPGDTTVVYGPLRVTSPNGSQTLGVERFTANVLPGRQYLLEVARGDGAGGGLPSTLAVRLNGSPTSSRATRCSG